MSQFDLVWYADPFPMTVVSVGVTNALCSKVFAANGRNRLDRNNATASGVYDSTIQRYQQNHHDQKQEKVERLHRNLSRIRYDNTLFLDRQKPGA